MKKTCMLILLVFISLVYSAAYPEGAEKGKVLVALGDSYIAGEGIEPYYGQDAPMKEKCKNPDWLAHRSESGWPGMLRLPGVEGVLSDHRGENFFFAAASGARTSHLFLLTDEEKKSGMTAGFEKVYNRDGISGTTMLAPQLDIFDELKACEDWAREQGCTEFASDCELTNAVSQEFHRAVGFEEANRIVAYVRKI